MILPLIIKIGIGLYELGCHGLYELGCHGLYELG